MTPPSCNPDFDAGDACGGDPVGVWVYEDACISTDANAEAITGVCSDAVVGDTTFDGSNDLLLRADGFYTLSAAGTSRTDVFLPDSCVVITGLTCEQFATVAGDGVTGEDGVGGCDCVVETAYSQIDQGTYVADSDNGVITTDGGATYHYCIDGGALVYQEFGNGGEEPTFVLVP